MRIKLTLIILISLLTLHNPALAQIPEPTQEFRGLWVSQFKDNVLGNAAAEDALIAYAIANDFNYLICTNMFQILTASCGSFTSDMTKLQSFVAKAHNEGIEYVSGNVGSLATAEKMQNYNNCGTVTGLQKLDMITYECEFYNAATNGSCLTYSSYISQLTSIKAICSATTSSMPGRPLICEAYIGGEGSTGLVLTYSSEAEMEAISSVADHILITYYRPLPTSSSGNFFNWTIERLNWIAKTGTPSNIVLLLKSRNTDGNNMNAYLATFPGTHYNAVRDPYLSWVEGTAHNPLLTKGYREKYNDGTYPWLTGIQVKGFTWFEHAANLAISPVLLPISIINFNARCNEHTVDLKWETFSETNVKVFTIEKSFDGINFSSIANIKAYGNSSDSRHYNYSDINREHRTTYYRLKQREINGSYKYFKTISINCNDKEADFTISPNPVNDGILRFFLPKTSKVEIINTSGNTIFSNHYTAGTHYLVLNQPPGLYLIKYIENNHIQTRKIILK